MIEPARLDTARAQRPAAARRSPRLDYLRGATIGSVLVIVVMDLIPGHYLHVRELVPLLSVLLTAVAVLGLALRLPVRSVAMSLLVVAAAGIVVWLLPLQRREWFARDVAAIEVGMSRSDVSGIMSGHVVRDSGPARRFAGKTWYEAEGEGDAFDNYCLVSWEADRVSSVELSED